MSKIIMLIGPPGSGKGTQAELIANNMDLYNFETSRILEEGWKNAGPEDYFEVDGKKFFLLEEKKLFDEGFLCSPPFVAFLIKKKIKELAEEGEGIVFSGSPRTLHEGEDLLPFLIGLFGAENMIAININVTDEVAIWRNTRRRICGICRSPVPYTEETKKLTVCPRCGGVLVTRTLDTEEAMKIRLKEYMDRTYPLLDLIAEKGIKVVKVHGEQSIEDVHEEIMEKIKS